MDFVRKYNKYNYKLNGGWLNLLSLRPDFHGSINNFPTQESQTNEINRLIKIHELSIKPDFIASGQNIDNFQTFELANNEVIRLNVIDFLSKCTEFIESGQNIINFQTSELARAELLRLGCYGLEPH
jgi:hypothetical protein